MMLEWSRETPNAKGIWLRKTPGNRGYDTHTIYDRGLALGKDATGDLRIAGFSSKESPPEGAVWLAQAEMPVEECPPFWLWYGPIPSPPEDVPWFDNAALKELSNAR